MTVKRVIFIRPGETEWNRQGRFQGWVNVPLNQHGRQQAQQLAKYIRNIGLSALYTSDLPRALETAELLAEKLGFAPIPDARLRERSIGAWQGLTLEQIRDWYPAEYKQLLADPLEYRMPGGESRSDVRARMAAAFSDITAQTAGETVGILSHTTAIHTLLDELIPNCFANRLEVSNTSVTTIARGQAGGWQLITCDDVTHLEGLETQRFPEPEDKHDSGD